jgi:cell division protease FtsH
MVTEYGMSEAIGPLTLGNRQEQVFLGRDIARDRNYSEEVASTIDKEVRRLIETSYERAKKLINGNLEKLHLLAEELIKKETLEGEEVKLLLEGKVKQLEERKDDKQEINPIVRFNPE